MDAKYVVFKVMDSGPPVQVEEPLVVFRAQDRLSMAAINGYLDAVKTVHPDHAYQEVWEKIADEFDTWQSENPARLKWPD